MFIQTLQLLMLITKCSCIHVISYIYMYQLWCVPLIGISLWFQLRDVSMVIGEQAELRQKKMMKVVKRLVFLMFAYAAIMALAFTPLSVLQRHAKLLEFYIKQYFGCLMFFTPPKCPKSKYFKLKKITFVMAIYSYPFANNTFSLPVEAQSVVDEQITNRLFLAYSFTISCFLQKKRSTAYHIFVISTLSGQNRATFI